MVTSELILDLAKLLKKHGADSLKELADYLKEPSNSEDLRLILESALSLNTKVVKKTAKKEKSIIKPPKALEELRTSDPAKYNLLNQLYEKLVCKELLPTLRDVNFFREDIGLAQSKAKSHNKSIPALINDLAKLSVEQLAKIEMKTPHAAKGLQEWSDLILNKPL
jgi:hypothetical protein